MNSSTKALYVNKFIRAFPDEFSIKEFIKYLSYVDCKITKDEALEILNGSQYLFDLGNGKYITRAGAFTGKYFSVVLSKEECENQCFMPGHRCVPFVDPEMLSATLIFIWNNIPLNYKPVEFSKEFALEHFLLYGEEYESQYIANDPAMSDFELSSNDFEIPMKVTLQSVDLSPLFKRYNIEPGDRLVMNVIKWDEGVIDIKPELRIKSETPEITQEDINRNKWYKTFESAMLECFDQLGPCASIEEQLADVFFLNSPELCIKDCGSVEEFLKRTKSVSMELFGVETRLWKSGETIPAVGNWTGDSEEGLDEPIRNLIYSVPDYVLDEYLRDYAFNKKKDVSDLLIEMFPKNSYLPQEYREELLLHIEDRNGIILKSYNWFADHQIGKIRHKALGLYKKVSSLVYEIDRVGGRYKKFPQQELVILIQLYSHITKLIETLCFDANSLVKDMDTISVSLDGMDFNFLDIEPGLRNAVMSCKKSDFTVVE